MSVAACVVLNRWGIVVGKQQVLVYLNNADTYSTYLLTYLELLLTYYIGLCIVLPVLCCTKWMVRESSDTAEEPAVSKAKTRHNTIHTLESLGQE